MKSQDAFADAQTLLLGALSCAKLVYDQLA